MAGRAWVERLLFFFFASESHHLTPQSAKILILKSPEIEPIRCYDHFEKLKIKMEELGVMNIPECIYCGDEKGCSLCLHAQPLVPTRKDGKRVNLVAVEHEEKSPSCPVEVPFDQPVTKPPLQKCK
jgi:hypothetical protein